MIYRASDLIAEAFDRHEVKYRVSEIEDASIVEAGFDVAAGPQVIARFISRDNDNDVAIRVFSLICKIPEARRAAALEACNKLTGMVRFFKFYLSEDSNINMEADLPVSVGDDSVGECCFELFARLMHVLDTEFHVLTEALYAAPAEPQNGADALLQLLSQLQEKTVILDDEFSGEPAEDGDYAE